MSTFLPTPMPLTAEGAIRQYQIARARALGAIACRVLGDGRELVLWPIASDGGYRLCVNTQGSAETPDEAWLYAHLGVAMGALLHWDGNGVPPDGWHR